MVEHIEDFQKLNISVNNILEEYWIDVFIGALKDNIQYHVRLWEPNTLEKEFRLERKIMVTRKPTTHNYKYGSVATPRLPQPARLTPQKMEEKREKGLFYNYDRKYKIGRASCRERVSSPV